MADRTPFSETLYAFVERGETLFLITLLAGAALFFFGFSQGSTLVTVALGGLAVVFFLMAYRPPRSSQGDPEKKMDFIQLLVLTIIPKVLWIGCAVGTIGLLLRHLQTGNDGYRQMLIIQSVVTLGTLIVVGFAAATGVSGLRNLLPIYFRALPLTLAAGSLLLA